MDEKPELLLIAEWIQIDTKIYNGTARICIYVKNQTEWIRKEEEEDDNLNIMVFEKKKMKISGFYRDFKTNSENKRFEKFEKLLAHLDRVNTVAKKITEEYVLHGRY